MTVKNGRCMCVAVTFEYEGPENWCAHCHCEDCRRNTSLPFATWFGVPNTASRFTGAEPHVFESSPGARRYFCHVCGTPMAFATDRKPDEFHSYAARLEHPESFALQYHVFVKERLPWIKLADGLPPLRRFERRIGVGQLMSWRDNLLENMMFKTLVVGIKRFTVADGTVL